MNSNKKQTVSAGGVVRKIENGEVFVALVRELGKPDWVLPKGHIEKDETIEEAAIREIREETGLKNIKIIKKLGVKERLSFDGDEYKTIHYFLCDRAGNSELSQEIIDGANRLEAKWFPLDNLPELFWNEQKEVISENLQTIKTTFSSA